MARQRNIEDAANQTPDDLEEVVEESETESLSHYAKYKEAHLKYQNSEKGKAARERYQNSTKGKEARKRYQQRQRELNKVARQLLRESGYKADRADS
jgi:hypothetical protein